MAAAPFVFFKRPHFYVYYESVFKPIQLILSHGQALGSFCGSLLYHTCLSPTLQILGLTQDDTIDTWQLAPDNKKASPRYCFLYSQIQFLLSPFPKQTKTDMKTSQCENSSPAGEAWDKKEKCWQAQTSSQSTEHRGLWSFSYAC